jgi:hypothetical protein
MTLDERLSVLNVAADAHQFDGAYFESMEVSIS